VAFVFQLSLAIEQKNPELGAGGISDDSHAGGNRHPESQHLPAGNRAFTLAVVGVCAKPITVGRGVDLHRQGGAGGIDYLAEGDVGVAVLKVEFHCNAPFESGSEANECWDWALRGDQS
jgi:hypothetical protein